MIIDLNEKKDVNTDNVENEEMFKNKNTQIHKDQYFVLAVLLLLSFLVFIFFKSFETHHVNKKQNIEFNPITAIEYSSCYK